MRFVARIAGGYPRTVIAVWLLAAVAAAIPASQLTKRIGNGGYSVPGSQTQRVEELTGDNFPGAAGEPLAAVFVSPEPAAKRLRARARALAAQLNRRPGAEARGTVYISPARTMAVLPFVVRESLADAQKNVASLRDWIEARAGPDVTVAGRAAVWHESTEISKQDLERSERISVPLSLIVLVAAFLSVVAALVPIGLALITLTVTFAVLGLLSYAIGMTVYVTNTAQVLGLGLAIDYSLFIVTRYREHRGDGLETSDAIAAAVTTTGRAVVVSGITIAVGLSSLTVLGIGVFSSMALGASAAAAIAALGAITLVPAVLQLLGPRIDRLSFKAAVRAADRGRLWRALSRLVVRHRWPVLISSVLILLVCAVPLLGSRLMFSGTDGILPAGNPLRETDDAVMREFGKGLFEPLEIVTRQDRVRSVRRAVAGSPAVAEVLPPEAGRRGWARMYAMLEVAGGTTAADEAVRRVRRVAAGAAGEGAAFVGGQPALGVDLIDRVQSRFPLMVAVVCVLAFLLLMLALRSIVVPLKAVLTNLLSVAATVGLVTLIFQDLGGAQGLAWFVTPFLFAIVFGLSMDYEIFLLSRVREEYDRGAGSDGAVARALQQSGRSITLAALVMMLVFLASSFTTLESFRQLGVGMAIAVFLDATLVRCALVPAALAVLGDRNWWLPGFLARHLPGR
ncbi:MAG TPA: MMPL family transporter [Solirubrobacterales bacterium]|nr:MMPL family transporter [Solirubrobacterales bacterium]